MNKIIYSFLLFTAISISAGHHEAGNSKDWEIKAYTSAEIGRASCRERV